MSVSICDPIAGTTTNFVQCSDEYEIQATSGNIPQSCQNKVAKIFPSPRRLPNAGTPFFPEPFDGSPPHLPKSFAPPPGQRIDLGTQEVEGVQAHGYRNLTTGSSQIDACKSPVNLAREWWLSEELAIAISEVDTTRSEPVHPHPSPTTTHVVCSRNGSMELSNIQQVEPAPELFKVPPDSRNSIHGQSEAGEETAAVVLAHSSILVRQAQFSQLSDGTSLKVEIIGKLPLAILVRGR